MIATFQNSAFVLPIGVFFTLMVAVAGEGGFEPSELVVPDVPEESTEPPDKPSQAGQS